LGTSIQCGQQLGRGNAKHGCDLNAEVLEAHVLLADLGPMEHADVGELLLGPFPRNPKFETKKIISFGRRNGHYMCQ